MNGFIIESCPSLSLTCFSRLFISSLTVSIPIYLPKIIIYVVASLIFPSVVGSLVVSRSACFSMLLLSVSLFLAYSGIQVELEYSMVRLGRSRAVVVAADAVATIGGGCWRGRSSERRALSDQYETHTTLLKLSLSISFARHYHDPSRISLSRVTLLPTSPLFFSLLTLYPLSLSVSLVDTETYNNIWRKYRSFSFLFPSNIAQFIVCFFIFRNRYWYNVTAWCMHITYSEN